MYTTLLAIALGLTMFNTGFMLISFNTQDKLNAELNSGMNNKDGRNTLLYQLYFNLAEDSQKLTKKIERLEDDLEDVQGDLEDTQDVLSTHHHGLHSINASVLSLLGSMLDVAERAGVPAEFHFKNATVTSSEELAEYLAAKLEEDIHFSMADDIVESFSKLLAEVEEGMKEADDDDDTD